jgi:lipopolysaccharide transport system permease protein
MSMTLSAGHADLLQRFRRLGELTASLAWRDIAARYRGANLGILWTILNPILMLAVYGIAFGYVFKARWPGAETGTSFVELLFIGIAVHGFVAECINRAPGIIASNPSFVKKVVFPLGVLPAVVTLAAFFNFMTLLAVYAGYRLLMGDGWSFHNLQIAVVLIPLFLMALSGSYLLAFLGVYFRDLSQIMPTISMAMLFLSSAIVPVSTLPQSQQTWFRLNPLTFYIDESRNALFWHRSVDWEGIGLRIAIWIVVLAICVWLFRRARKGFADVI